MKPTIPGKTLLCLVALTALVGGVHAEERYPKKPIRIIVPFSPGGGTDLQARVLTAKLYENTGQIFVVDNRAGASGLIGAELTVNSPPDGHTMLFSTATLAINNTLYRSRMRFNPLSDLAPITWFSSTPLVLVIHPSVPARSVTELVALARRSPGLFNIGMGVPGSTPHLSAEMLKQMANVDAVLVPYKGGGPAMAALLSGEIELFFATGPVAGPQIRSGRVRGLAVTTPTPSSAFPDLPTMSSFFPGFESDNWYALFYPAGTPKALVDKMRNEIERAAKSEQVRAYMEKEGLDAVVSTPEQLGALFRREITKYANVITIAGIKPE